MTLADAQLEVSVLHSQEEVGADVRDRRPATLRLFGPLTAGQREGVVHDAWTIGLRALGNAHAAGQEARLADIGAALLGDIDRQLGRHVQSQQQTIAEVLGRFFDPRDGQVTQRLTAFVDDQGVLARLLDRYLGPQNSVLAQALARQVGESSPLFKALSPTDSQGLVKILEGQLRAVMHEGHAELVRALDPLAEDGAVARMLRSLREELKGADEDRARQLSAALAALDANDEQSLLSRLVREAQQAREQVLQAINPEGAGSPLAVLKQSLTALLEKQGLAQADAERRSRERQEQLERAIGEALARIETRKAVDRVSPRGGHAFEDAVVQFLADATGGAPCTLEVTGTTVGEVGRCKKGDAVVRFTSESAFAGAGVVFEAKREAGYTAQMALDELDLARKNRNAAAGVFVLARSHAGPTFPGFARHGSNVLVVWDEEDPATDPYLRAAIMVGLGLVSRSRATGDAGDVAALRDIDARIDAELTRLDKIEKHAETARRSSEAISDEVRKARKALDTLLEKARSTLRALNVELREEAVERESPIALPVSTVSRLAPANEAGCGRGSYGEVPRRRHERSPRTPARRGAAAALSRFADESATDTRHPCYRIGR